MFDNRATRKIIFFIAIALIGLQLNACSEDRANQAELILSQMTLEEKIGQVIQADIASVTPAEVKEYNLGSILNFVLNLWRYPYHLQN